MPIFSPKIWLSLLLVLLCSLATVSPALCLDSGTSCIAAWNGEDCPQPCALAALQPKETPCPSCHHHPGLPLPLKPGDELLGPSKRLDQTTFVPLMGNQDQGGRHRPRSVLLVPQRPLLPNKTLAALRTVVLRN